MITFEQVTKIYPGGVEAVDNLSLEVGEGEILVLLGTSGSGKTTALKMVNRLIEPTSGRILINGVDVMEQDLIRLRRGIGYAIQHIGIFPHMTVGENVAVVPRLLNWPSDRVDNRVEEMLTLVGLNPNDYRGRFPAQLSGGQLQRIGVARALAAQPPIVLMDEPFGALDPITREQLQNEFLELQKKIRKTIIFVTHDIFEAVKMGGRIAILDRGKLQQVASPAEIVARPAGNFVEHFLGRHRFQLLLLTRTVESISGSTPPDGPGPGKKPEYFLKGKNSLIEALNIFKKSQTDRLPVFDQDQFLRYLGREELLGVITRVLGEAGESG